MLLHLIDKMKGGRIRRFYEFDLAKLTLEGWLLCASTLVIFISAAFAAAELGLSVDNLAVRYLVGSILIVVAAAWFLGCRWLLTKLGVSIYHDFEDQRDDS
jgi:hypothetical protein